MHAHTPTWILVGIVALALLPATGAGAENKVSLRLPVEFESVSPTDPGRILGTYRLDVAPDAECDAPITNSVEVAAPNPNATITVDPGLWTVAADQASGGQAIHHGFTVTIEPTEAAFAYSAIHFDLVASTTACSNTNATQARYALVTHVGYRPGVDLEVADKQANAFAVDVTNKANSAVTVDWRHVQPGLGRVHSGGSIFLGAPGSQDDSGSILAAKGPNFSPDEDAFIEVRVMYAGEVPRADTPVHVQRIQVFVAGEDHRSERLQALVGTAIAVAVIGLVVGTAIAYNRRKG